MRLFLYYKVNSDETFYQNFYKSIQLIFQCSNCFLLLALITGATITHCLYYSLSFALSSCPLILTTLNLPVLRLSTIVEVVFCVSERLVFTLLFTQLVFIIFIQALPNLSYYFLRFQLYQLHNIDYPIVLFHIVLYCFSSHRKFSLIFFFKTLLTYLS